MINININDYNKMKIEYRIQKIEYEKWVLNFWNFTIIAISECQFSVKKKMGENRGEDLWRKICNGSNGGFVARKICFLSERCSRWSIKRKNRSSDCRDCDQTKTDDGVEKSNGPREKIERASKRGRKRDEKGIK